MAESDDALNQVCNTIENTLSITSGDSLSINWRQCILLRGKLKDTQEALGTIQKSLRKEDSEVVLAWRFSRARVPAVAQELHRVVKRAQKLITDCCCAGRWLEVAIKQGHPEEKFVVILYDLQWCMSLLLSLCPCNVVASEFGNKSLHGGNVFDEEACGGKLDVSDKLRVAAKEDEETLNDRFRQLKGNHVCSADCGNQNDQNDQNDMSRVCLASQLVEIWKAAYSHEPVTAGRSSTNDFNGSPCTFLRVNEKVLHQGKLIAKGGKAIVSETMWRGEKWAKKTLFFLSIEKTNLEAEISALAISNHPHLVRLICCSEAADRCELVMEYMDMDLYGLLETHRVRHANSPFSLFQAVDLMLQIAQGMEHIHTKMGMAHRDLKSLNVLVTPEDPSSDDGFYSVKVADFGLTKIKNAICRYSSQTPETGTRQWMAPEVKSASEEENLQGEEKPCYPRKMDVYSFGIVFSEVLTGQKLFKGVTMKDIRKRVKAGERPVLPEGTPYKLADLIRRCWHGNPSQRPHFSEICKELRYIKGLLIQGKTSILQRKPDIIHVTSPAEGQVQVQKHSGALANISNHQSHGITTKMQKIEPLQDR